MKTPRILQAISLLLILIIAVSCRSSRSTTGKQYPRNTYPAETPTKAPTNTSPVYVDGGKLPPGQAKKIYGGQSAKAYAPGQRKKYGNRYPLVIVHTTGIVISRHFDGRYYYKNKAGYTYWKGYDGRYFLDEKHLKEIEYDQGEYEDWKFKGQKNNKAQDEKVKEEPKEKDADTKGKDQNQKVKGSDQKGKDQTNQKAKDDNSQKGKSKSKA